MTVAESIAKHLQLAKVTLLTHVPGSNGTSIFEAFYQGMEQSVQISFHEEVAFTMAHGAALSGKRACCVIKSHGFIKAGNSVLDAKYAGTTAAFVILVLEDEAAQHSDCKFEIRPFLKSFEIPFRELKKPEEDMTEFMEESFTLSEKWQLPIVILIKDHFLSQSISSSNIPAELKLPAEPVYKRNIIQHLVCPLFAETQKQIHEYKMRWDPDFIQFHQNPVPVLQDFSLPAWDSTIRTYKKVFSLFQQIPKGICFGDTGISSLFALEPYQCVDITTYMGGSIPLAVGATLAGKQDCWAITGDFSFISAGILGLFEAKNQNLALKILILNNREATTTGGQKIQPHFLDDLLLPFQQSVKRIPVDELTIQDLQETANAKTLQILVVDC